MSWTERFEYTQWYPSANQPGSQRGKPNVLIRVSTMMNVYTGTSGFSYKEWKGAFYPEKIANSSMLRYYAERLPAVEINSTFYRLPKPEALASWADEVPEGFRFVLKASRRITHFKRLKDAEDVTAYLLSTAASLGPKLGPILFQLPPNFAKDAVRLQSFLALLPGGRRAAFEFRHASWRDVEVEKILSDNNVAWCVADTGEDPAVLIRTADWGYLRLRRPDYSEEGLSDWAAQIRAQAWADCFVFFKHEDEGAGPKMACRFLEMFGD
ncbi:MAG: DUF72 domain-containing protein [Rhodothermales bacterium]